MFRLLPLLLIFIPLIWFVLTFGPAVKVELSYQLQQVTSELGIDSIAGIFWPQVQPFELETLSDHRQFGLVIPKIRLDEPVVFNVDPNDEAAYIVALKQGIAHAAGTGLPGSNQLGYYFAHSAQSAFTRQFKAIFYLLGKLEPGDEVYVWHEGEKFKYTVVDSTVTVPSDVSFIGKDYPTETIVLQTCWPLGFAHQRKLVFAERED